MIDENVEIGLTNKNRIARNESAGWVGISGDEEVLPDLIRGRRDSEMKRPPPCDAELLVYFPQHLSAFQFNKLCLLLREDQPD